jgi:hypothetical protein
VHHLVGVQLVQCTQDLLVHHARDVLCGVTAMSGRAVHTGSSGTACAKCSVWGHSNEWSCSAHRIFWYIMRKMFCVGSQQ